MIDLRNVILEKNCFQIPGDSTIVYLFKQAYQFILVIFSNSWTTKPMLLAKQLKELPEQVQ